MSNLAAGAVSAAEPTLASFYPLVWWIIAIKVVVILCSCSCSRSS